MNDPVELPSGACARVHNRLDALLLGELAALARARDEGHLEACATCAREHAEHARVHSAARAGAHVTENEFVRANAALEVRLAALPTPAARSRFTQRALPALAAAAAALLAFFALELSGQIAGPRLLPSAGIETGGLPEFPPPTEWAAGLQPMFDLFE